jgi:SAM-dependent methyltransferase
MCKFLKGPNEVVEATKAILQEGLIPSPCPPKNWDLSLVLPQLTDGDILDMGCSGSMVLINCVRKGLIGKKFGIDLVAQPAPDGIIHIIGDLTRTSLPSEDFDFITCLSVIEHGVNAYDFFRESSRLLRKGGKLFVTFDYWDPKLHTAVMVLGLPWCIFSKQEICVLIALARTTGLELLHPIDWTIGEPVIKPGYYSPCELSYTFGLIEFRKL